jgi:hypothetical protein
VGSYKGEGLISAEWPEPAKAAARAHLAHILESPQFRSSKRCSAFLRHVVEHAVEGRLESLKERILGVEVFERDPNYDTNQDPVVRSTAGEVRKRLAQYYTEPGHEQCFRITLPTGSYVAEVHLLPEKEEPPPVAPSEPDPRRRWAPWGVAVGGVAVAAMAAILLLTRPSELDDFWSPVLAPRMPLLVCVGQPHVYKFAGTTQERMNRWFETDANPASAPPPVLPSEVVPMWDRFLGLGDVQAFSRVSGYFGKARKQVEMRGVRSVALSDLRGRPVVLIGAFNNDWTLSLGGELRFYFDRDPQNGRDFVRDRQNPANNEWQIETALPPRKLAADYAVVTRVLNANTEQTVIIAAGITEIGTQAASEFVTNADYFAEAVQAAPSDWRRKNMQFVLSAKVMSGTAGPPRVVAVHYW